MRILLLDTKPIRRGAQIFVHALADELKKKDIITKRVYLFKNTNALSLVLNEDDEILNASENSFLEKYLTIQPFLLFHLIRTINKFKPDLILLNGSKTLKYGSFAKQLSSNKTPLIYRVIDSPKYWNTSFLTKIYYTKLVIPFLDAAIGVSKASLLDMVNLYAFKKPTEVIHRALNFDQFKNIETKLISRQKLGISIDHDVLLFLGNITAQKRPDRFIEIIKRIRITNKNVIGIIIGDGPLKLETEKIVQKENLENHILFMGYQEKVGEFISAADILLLTSDTEGLPGVVLEAGYFMVPAIASNVGGIAECVKDGESGYIINKNNIDDFVTKTIYLLNNPTIRNNMGLLSREIAIQNFDINNISNDYHSFFKYILKCKK